MSPDVGASCAGRAGGLLSSLMRTYVINMSTAHERMAHMTSQFGSLGIPFERFDAVRGDWCRTRAPFDRMPKPRHRPWFDGELGTLFSHYDLWAKIASGDDDYAAIFEDDVHVSPLLKSFLSAPLPPGMDLVKLETFPLRPTTYQTAPFASIAGATLHKLLNFHWGGAGYVISKRAARMLGSRAFAFDLPIDHLLFEPMHRAAAGFSILQCVPGLVAQDEALSLDQRRGGSLSSSVNRPPFAGKIARPGVMERLRQLPPRLLERVESAVIPRTVTPIPFDAPPG